MDSCVFCDFERIKENTLATIRGFYITATLGQITNGGYLLIIPRHHVSCLGDLSREQIEWLSKIIAEVAWAINDEYGMGVTVFEHGIIGQTIPHAHFHLIPAAVDMTARICTDFDEAEKETLFDLQVLREKYGKRKEPYLFWSDDSGLFNVCWNPPAPSMYLRLVVAEMLGVPERGDWKGMDACLDKQLRETTIERMTPYFLP